jgi:hypothetical protein
MYYNKSTMFTKHLGRKVSLCLVVVGMTIAHPALAGTVGPIGGPYVPVYDETTNTNFKEYIDLFNNQLGEAAPNGSTDSLRDLLSGGNPQGLAVAECAKGNNIQAAYAKKDGPWEIAVGSSTASGTDKLPSSVPPGVSQDDPSDGPFIQINYSNSLRCLLRELVEWEKLGLSLQIHSLLKEYIADAQTKQLNNQLKSKVAAANLDWSRSGNEVNIGGIESSQPVFSTNISQSKYNVADRQGLHIIDQAAADPAIGSSVGSLSIAAPWRLDTAASMANNMRGMVDDPFNWTESITGQRLTVGENPLFADEYDVTKYFQSFNDPSSLKGGLLTFLETATNPSNNPIGASQLADMAAKGRIERQLETTIQKQTSSGFVPATTFDENPSNPYGLDEQYGVDTNPAGQNEQVVTEMASQGDRQVEQGNELDALGGNEAEQQSTKLNTQGGVLGYDTTPLATAQTGVNSLVEELYVAIQNGYIGTGPDTKQWAQGTLLSIYDIMAFNDQTPAIEIPKISEGGSGDWGGGGGGGDTYIPGWGDILGDYSWDNIDYTTIDF